MRQRTRTLMASEVTQLGPIASFGQEPWQRHKCIGPIGNQGEIVGRFKQFNWALFGAGYETLELEHQIVADLEKWQIVAALTGHHPS